MHAPTTKARTFGSRPALILLSTLLVCGLTGVASPYEYNLLPANGILEASLGLSALFLLRKPDKATMLFITAAALYVLCSFAIMKIFNPAHFLDFLQAYKSYIYIIPLSLFVSRDKFSGQSVKLLLSGLILFLIIKYGYSRLLQLTPRMGDRPGLYTENNFELILLFFVYYISISAMNGKTRAFLFAAVALITILSGSRSAVLALLILFSFTFLTKINYKTVVTLAVFALLGLAALNIFVRRMEGGIEDIDRFYFLTIFLYETRSWGILQYLLGSMPLTPLSNFSCAALSAYHDLYSFSGDDTCYSVILHSYLLRVLFDHGILGMLFAIGFLAYGLKRANYSNKDIACLTGIILSSGLSVSAFNSIFVAIAMAIAFSYQPHQKT